MDKKIYNFYARAQNDVQITRKIKVSRPTSTPTLENEQVPSKEELSRIFRLSSPRVRVAEALIAFADISIGVLGNHDGSDGLTLRDLPELGVEDGGVEFTRIPMMVVVRPGLSMARHRYFTFLSGEGCTYLKEYLDSRIRQGEALKPDSPVIGHERSSASRRAMFYHIMTLRNTRKNQELQLETRQAQLYMNLYSTYHSARLASVP